MGIRDGDPRRTKSHPPTVPPTTTCAPRQMPWRRRPENCWLGTRSWAHSYLCCRWSGEVDCAVRHRAACPDHCRALCQVGRAVMVTKDFFSRSVSLWRVPKGRATVSASTHTSAPSFMTALLGFASALCARASAANRRKSISACQLDDSVNRNATAVFAIGVNRSDRPFRGFLSRKTTPLPAGSKNRGVHRGRSARSLDRAVLTTWETLHNHPCDGFRNALSPGRPSPAARKMPASGQDDQMN